MPETFVAQQASPLASAASTVRVRVLSDLHLEFSNFQPPALEVDVTVLAGDIGVGSAGVKWAAETFPNQQVVYIAGNHEFYRHEMHQAWEAMRAAAPANVHVLENEFVVIGGVRFLGCSLWTDYALFGFDTQLGAMEWAGQALADHRLIRLGESTFMPKDALALHVRSRRWLEAMLAEPFAGKTVVVTHHAPSRGSLAARFSHDLLSGAFVSDLSPLMHGDRVALWVHGHTHSKFDYWVEGTRVISNARGYPLRSGGSENQSFDPGFVVEVPLIG